MGPHAAPDERLIVPTFVSGLPLHPLIVHAVVVLLPMAVLGAVLIAVWPAIRARWAWPVVVLTVAAVVAIPLATSTGEGLEHSLRAPRPSRHTPSSATSFSSSPHPCWSASSRSPSSTVDDVATAPRCRRVDRARWPHRRPLPVATAS